MDTTDACFYERGKKTFEKIWYIVDKNVVEPKRVYFLDLHQQLSSNYAQHWVIYKLKVDLNYLNPHTVDNSHTWQNHLKNTGNLPGKKQKTEIFPLIQIIEH